MNHDALDLGQRISLQYYLKKIKLEQSHLRLLFVVNGYSKSSTDRIPRQFEVARSHAQSFPRPQTKQEHIYTIIYGFPQNGSTV